MSVKIILRFTNGTLQGRKHEFTQSTRCLIGRSSDCDIQLPTTLEFMEVSRHHCVLKIDPPSLEVRDLGSRNGTFINGENIGQRRSREFPGASEEGTWHTLKEGDELRLGSLILRVEVSVKPERQKVPEPAGGGLGLWPFFRRWARSATPC